MHCTVFSIACVPVMLLLASCCICKCFNPQVTVALCGLTVLLQVDLDLHVRHLTATDQSLDSAALVVALDKMTGEELREIDRYLVCRSSLASDALL